MDNNATSTTRVSPNGVGALPFTPLLAPSAIFTTIFGVLLVLHAVLACKFRRYYGYAIGMFCGLLLEFLGYIAKVMLSKDRKDKNGYIMYVKQSIFQAQIITQPPLTRRLGTLLA